MDRRPLRLALINDYELVVAGLASLLHPFSHRVEVVEIDLQRLPTSPVDIAVYDTFAAPNGRCSKIVDLLADERVGTVVVYSFNEDSTAVNDTLSLGAAGYISKAVPIDQFVDALERIHIGERRLTLLSSPTEPNRMAAWPGQDAGLTARESEVLALITQGYSNDEITRLCYLSINTVKTYVRSTYRKAGVRTRAQAVAWAMHNGFDSRRQGANGHTHAESPLPG